MTMVDRIIVEKRYPGERLDIREFVRPHTPMVEELVARLGPRPPVEYWQWVIQNIAYPPGREAIMDAHQECRYRSRDGKSFLICQRTHEFWEYPSEVLRDRVADCFTGDTKILCIEDGKYRIYPIGDLESGVGKVHVLSYNWEAKRFEPKLLTGFFRKGRRPVVSVRLRNGGEFRCTPDHRFFAVPQWSVRNGRPVVREKRLSELARDRDSSGVEALTVACELPELRYTPQPPAAQIWLEGAYAAEGYATRQTANAYRVCIANDNPVYRNEIIQNLVSLGVPHTPSKRVKHAYVNIRASWLRDHLVKLGTNSFDMSLPWERLSGTREELMALLDGYARGDGYLHPKTRSPRGKPTNTVRVYPTSSDTLAVQLQLLHLILARPLHVWYQQRHGGAGKRPIWRLTENTNSVFREPIYPGLSRVYIRDIQDGGEAEVFDIEVQDNHNFLVADGWLLAHNCEGSAALLVSCLRHFVGPEHVFATVGWWHGLGHVWVTLMGPSGPEVMDTTLSRIPERLPVLETAPDSPYQPLLRFNDAVAFWVAAGPIPPRTTEPKFTG